MKVLCVFGRHNYGVEERGLSYEYSNFLPAFKELGHEVAFFDSWNKQLYHDFYDLNKKLLRKVEAEKPDVVFFVLFTYEIWVETLELIRKNSGAIIINWATDDSWKYEQSSRLVSPSFDIYATTYPSAIDKSLNDGYDNYVLTQWAACPNHLQVPLPANKCKYSVTFVGSANANRRRYISKLRKSGIDVECFGYGWPSGPVASDEIPKIIRQSIISLNFSSSGLAVMGFRGLLHRQIKARLFEVPGMGGFLLTEAAESLHRYYTPGVEVCVFDDVDDLISKIKYYLIHSEERDAISMAGYKKTSQEHTYTQRLAPLINLAIQRVEASSYASRCKHETELHREPHQIEKPRNLTVLMRAVKWGMLLVCNLIFGKRRGGRAARRILFEISWRIAGQSTYSARGWPGRLFYEDS